MIIEPLSEQRVDEMIAEGHRIMDAAIEQYKPIAIFGAFSGGNDSIVSTHFAAREYGAAALHCRTGVGLKATTNHVLDVCERFDFHLISPMVQPEGPPAKKADGRPFDPAELPAGRWTDGGTSYEEYCLNFGMPGSAMHDRMYQRLKERSIAQVQRDAKAGKSRHDFILIVSGIRHDESSVRAGYKRDTQRDGKATRVWVNPFYWRSATDFEAYRQEFGLPRNPVKARIGISGECLCGAFAGAGEKEAIRTVDAGMGSYLDELESHVQSNGFPWCWGQDPPQWWQEWLKGQGLLFDMGVSSFRPMCVGCKLRK